MNGVPVHVNPESMILSNTQASTALGLVDIEVGPDDITVLQVNGVPVHVNPESMIIQNT